MPLGMTIEASSDARVCRIIPVRLVQLSNLIVRTEPRIGIVLVMLPRVSAPFRTAQPTRLSFVAFNSFRSSMSETNQTLPATRQHSLRHDQLLAHL